MKIRHARGHLVHYDSTKVQNAEIPIRVRRLLPSMKSIHHSYIGALISPLDLPQTQKQQ